MFQCKSVADCAVLDVIAVISNPHRYKRRYQLFEEFCVRMKREPKVRLTTVELQQRGMPFQTSADIKLRTDHILWLKECLMNVAVNHLPPDWEYVAWIDADVEFVNKDWVADTINQLQIYSVVQLWSHATDLGPNGEILQVHSSFMYNYMHKTHYNPCYGNYWHPGYAWACRRSAYNNFGGFIEFSILGSADLHMASAFVGRAKSTIPKGLHPNYTKLIEIFEARCEKYIKRNVGYVNGTVLHYFHGDKKNRKYWERWNILRRNDYDPLADIKKDDNQLLQLESDKIQLRDDLREYFRGRNEDSIDMLQHYQFIANRVE